MKIKAYKSFRVLEINFVKLNFIVQLWKDNKDFPVVERLS